MRVTYRRSNNKEYWLKRWANIPPDAAMENVDVYPLKYSEMVIRDDGGKILEAGCGAGRILRYYHNRHFNIVGIDFINVAVDKLKAMDPTLQVEAGDITKLQFKDQEFKYVLAFGLYHNLEHDLDLAIAETYRVTERGGVVCASFRADNIQTRLTDWLADLSSKDKPENHRSFHKLNLTKREFVSLFKRAGFAVESVYPVQNMPILYKFPIFRASGHKIFNENLARKEGYKLSMVGSVMQKCLMKYMPNQFCNIYVLIARRVS